MVLRSSVFSERVYIRLLTGGPSPPVRLMVRPESAGRFLRLNCVGLNEEARIVSLKVRVSCPEVMLIVKLLRTGLVVSAV